MKRCSQALLPFVGIAKKCKAHRITATAGALAYLSLLSLVPLLTLGVSVVGKSPLFAPWVLKAQEFLFSTLVPATHPQIEEYLKSFMDKAAELGGTGAAFFLLTAFFLLREVERVFSTIMEKEAKRSFFERLALYWTIITLGPLLLGAGMAASSMLEQRLSFLLPLVQFSFSASGLLFLYKLLPPDSGGWREALIGALGASTLIELLRQGFGFYVRRAVNYDVIYGALASVPIFLIWLYALWVVLLLGVEIMVYLENEKNIHRP